MLRFLKLWFNSIWSDTTASLSFPYHTSENVPPQNPNQYFPHTQCSLQSQTCIRLSLPSTDHKIHLSCHFCTRSHYSSTLKQKLGAITSLEVPYLRTTFQNNLVGSFRSQCKVNKTSAKLPRGHTMSCPTHDLEPTINKPFTRLIGLRQATASQAVTHQSWVARFSPRVAVFSPDV